MHDFQGDDRGSWYGEPNAPPAILDDGILEAWLDRAAERADRAPQLVVVVGPIASGKTTLRRNQFSDRVSFDPADLYLALTDGEKTIPSNIADLVDAALAALARRAVAHRRDIVIEAVGAEHQPLLERVCGHATALGYHTHIIAVDASLETCKARNAAREHSNISAYHTELQAMLALLAELQRRVTWDAESDDPIRAWIAEEGMLDSSDMSQLAPSTQLIVDLAEHIAGAHGPEPLREFLAANTESGAQNHALFTVIAFQSDVGYEFGTPSLRILDIERLLDGGVLALEIIGECSEQTVQGFEAYVREALGAEGNEVESVVVERTADGFMIEALLS